MKHHVRCAKNGRSLTLRSSHQYRDRSPSLLLEHRLRAGLFQESTRSFLNWMKTPSPRFSIARNPVRVQAEPPGFQLKVVLTVNIGRQIVETV